MPFTPEQIAVVVHNANCGLQDILGDPCPSPYWYAATQEMKESTIDGVNVAMRGATPEMLHENWVAKKLADGWTHGPVKNDVNKTHPCLVPYDQLSPEQKVKDKVFQILVALLATS